MHVNYGFFFSQEFLSKLIFTFILNITYCIVFFLSSVSDYCMKLVESFLLSDDFGDRVLITICYKL